MREEQAVEFAAKLGSNKMWCVLCHSSNGALDSGRGCTQRGTSERSTAFCIKRTKRGSKARINTIDLLRMPTHAPHSSPFLDLRLMGEFLAALAILTAFPLSMRLRHALIPVVHHRVFLSCHPSQYRVYIAPPLDIESEISTYMVVTE